MEEENPWLDPESVKHKNIKSVRDKPNVKDSTKDAIKDITKDTIKDVTVKDSTKDTIKDVTVKDVTVKDSIYIGNLKKDDYKDFLDVLTNELSTKLPEESEKFAIKSFGEKWLNDFLSDINDLKTDIINSKIFPSQKEMLFLKYILLLNQAI